MDETELQRIIVADCSSLANDAPPLHFARLWHEVRRRREAWLETWLALMTALPSACILLAGFLALSMGAWHVAAAFCAAAFWLAWHVELPRLSFPARRRARPGQ